MVVMSKYLTFCILVDSSTVISWKSPFVIYRGVNSILSLLFCCLRKIQLANSVDPNQTPHYVASDLGLHCLGMTIYGFPGKNGLSFLKFK